MPLKDGTLSADERRAAHQEVMDRKPTITRCGAEGCSWTFEGEAADGREMFLAHQRLRHGVGMDDPGPEPTQEAIETSGDPDLDQIRDILGHGTEVEIRLPREPVPWRREWIESLGGRIVIDPEAPMPLALQHDRKDDMNGDEGRSALDAMDRGEAQRPERSAMANGKRPLGYWTRERIIEAIQDFATEHGRPPVSTEWFKSSFDRPSTDVVKRVMGSWADAVVAAGYERPVRGGRAASQATPSEPAESGTTRNDPEPPGEPTPLPVPAAPPEPPAPSPVAADPEKVDVFELFETMATQERIEFYERQAATAQAKAGALRLIREALDGVREPA